jgi:hypothetical protein
MVLSPRVASSSRRIEFTWALILASARHILTESNSVRFGGWQQTVGMDLRGKTWASWGLGGLVPQGGRWAAFSNHTRRKKFRCMSRTSGCTEPGVVPGMLARLLLSRSPYTRLSTSINTRTPHGFSGAVFSKAPSRRLHRRRTAISGWARNSDCRFDGSRSVFCFRIRVGHLAIVES